MARVFNRWCLNVLLAMIAGSALGAAIDLTVERVSFDYVYPPRATLRSGVFLGLVAGTLLGLADWWLGTERLPYSHWMRAWRWLMALPGLVALIGIALGTAAKLGWIASVDPAVPVARHMLCSGLVQSVSFVWPIVVACIVGERMRACSQLSASQSGLPIGEANRD